MTGDKLRLAKLLFTQGLTVREAAARIKVGKTAKTALYAALGANGSEAVDRCEFFIRSVLVLIAIINQTQ
nr:hypothetical protein [Azospirillum argentinense]